MQPVRSDVINGVEINEFYWNGKTVVYIDHQLFDGSYTEARDIAKGECPKCGGTLKHGCICADCSHQTGD